MKLLTLVFLCVAASFAADLTGNWAAPVQATDGSGRKTYFRLKQEDAQITGHIWERHIYFTIKESTGDASGFTLTATMKDGKNERVTHYEGKLAGDQLQLTTRRNGKGQPSTLAAVRVPDTEGVYPARTPPPALHKVAYNGLGKTPPMGWNSWNKFGARVDDKSVRDMADAIVTSGMRDAGYVYVNIDDTWEGPRDAKGNLTANNKFPDMKALADYIHSKGLKLGIYSSPGPNTCAGFEGSYGHEEQDAKTWAAWGVDYLKYDWCGARNLYSEAETQALYQKMGDALVASGRPIFYSFCQYGIGEVWKWGPDAGANAWRTTGDIRDTWESMSTIGFKQNDLAPFAKPGHWNDPDMLEIGNGGMTDTEYQTHMSLWSMLAAPLLAGNDLRTASPAILAILTNRDVIAIDQDKLGKQAQRAWQAGEQEIWVRELSGGDRAIAIFNRGGQSASVKVTWADLAMKSPSQAKNLWTHVDEKLQGPDLGATVPSHGVVMLRVH